MNALARADALARLARSIESCERCPRLRAHCREVARTKRKAYRDEPYWGRPVPGFGDADARLWIVGLAPGAHGANRTGRMFTGDRSGDFLYAALHRAGFANQPSSRARDDGLLLRGAWISAAARCAPPDNKPSPEELAACAPWLERELALLGRWRVALALGGLAWNSLLALCERAGAPPPRPRPRFAHGVELQLAQGELAGRVLLGAYHPSQQNTFTGRLTPAMLDAVLARARALAERAR